MSGKSIANALYDAIGVRFDETPITAAKILDALQKKKTRVGPDGLSDGADPGRAMRRLTATTEQRERKRAAGVGADANGGARGGTA